MSHYPWWPCLALLAGPLLAACQDRAEIEVEAAGASTARIPDGYDLIEIGVLPGDNTSFPVSVNNRGEVAGVSTAQPDDSRVDSFHWNEDEGMTELGSVPDYRWVWAEKINDQGLIVGTLYSDIEPLRGFTWDDGELEIIEPPPGANEIGAYGVNRDGDIVGATDFTPGVREAYLLSEGEFLPLGMAEGGTYSAATAINQRGIIIGYGDNAAGERVGLLWVAGGTRMIDLSEEVTIPAFSPNAISSGGQLAGYSDDLEHAVFVEVGGQATDLGSLAGAAGYSEAFGINRSEQVVGTTRMPDGLNHAFVWEDGEMVDLNTLIDPAQGVVLTDAMDINDNGEIAAFGLRAGESRAFLLRPQ